MITIKISYLGVRKITWKSALVGKRLYHKYIQRSCFWLVQKREKTLYTTKNESKSQHKMNSSDIDSDLLLPMFLLDLANQWTG